MPMSIEELEQRYRRDYRPLSIGIGVVYAALLLAGVTAVVGDTRITGWISAAVFTGSQLPSISESSRFAPTGRRIRTVTND